jgi:hypothetical protein
MQAQGGAETQTQTLAQAEARPRRETPLPPSLTSRVTGAHSAP